jgi:NADH-quinone oxidoreductase subunit N
MSAAVPAVFEAVKVDYAAIAPMLVVVGGALIGVLVEAVAPRSTRYGAQLVLTLATIAAALVALFVWAVPHKAVTLGQSLAIDGPALFLQATLLVFGLLGVLAMSERFGGKSADAFTPMGASSPGSPQEAAATRAGFATSEVFPLALFALRDAHLRRRERPHHDVRGPRVLSLPLYILTGLARRRRLLSQEASLKYFLLGAFSSAFFLFGAALLYGFSGSSDLA